MREYLKQLNIVALINVWAEGEICRFTIEDMARICDKVIIVEDMSDEKTKAVVQEYHDKYPQLVIVGETKLKILDGESLLHRFLYREGEIRNVGLELVLKEHKKRPIDILMIPDSDEITTVNFPGMLQKFWQSHLDTVFMKPIEVFDSLHVIVDRGLPAHARIYKYNPEINALPWGRKNYFLPYSNERKIFSSTCDFVHLARLTKENRKLRTQLRCRESNPFMRMWRINKPAYSLSVKEYYSIFKNENFIEYKDYNGNIKEMKLIVL